MTLMQMKRDMSGSGMGDITDMKYNWYSNRIATTSTDATITIRELDECGGWVVKDGGEIKAAHAVSRPWTSCDALS